MASPKTTLGGAFKQFVKRGVDTLTDTSDPNSPASGVKEVVSPIINAGKKAVTAISETPDRLALLGSEIKKSYNSGNIKRDIAAGAKQVFKG